MPYLVGFILIIVATTVLVTLVIVGKISAWYLISLFFFAALWMILTVFMGLAFMSGFG